MSASPKKKFDAAVKVIQSLPKDGPFQPSNEMMLTFYGYFKQATEGPCKLGKPNFWEIVKKAKWDAWNKLGSLDRESAMICYVEELKKTLKVFTGKWNEMAKNNDPRIIEAMPQTHVVGDFMNTIGAFYEVVDEPSPIEGATVPSKSPLGGAAGGDQNHVDIDKRSGGPVYNILKVGDIDLNMSQRVEAALQTNGQTNTQTDGDSALPDMLGEKLPVTNGEVEEEEKSEEEEKEASSRDTSTDMFAGQGIQSSDSEEEFCDTSDNPIQEGDSSITASVTRIQMSTPLRNSRKQNRVHFANNGAVSTPNGRISPVQHETMETVENIHVPAGFPFITSEGRTPESDSLIVQVSEDTVDLSQTSVNDLSVRSNESTDNVYKRSGFRAEGGEGQPPGGRDNPQGQGQKSAQGQSSSGGGSSRTQFSQSGGGRRALLSGGGGAGGGSSSGGAGNPHQGTSGTQGSGSNQQIMQLLVRLQQDMNNVLDRMDRLEAERQRQSSERGERRSIFGWWPFSGRTGRTAFFILVWPVIVHVILNFLFRRRRR